MTQPAIAPQPPRTFEQLDTMAKEDLHQDGISVLYKGASGTGKTFNMLTFPQPIVVAYFDVNRKTLTDAMRAGVNVKPVFPNTWAEYQNIFVPAVKNRQLEARTIVVDTLDFLAMNLMWPSIQGTKSSLAQADFGTGLNRLVSTTTDLVEATRYIPGKRNYHVVMGCHLRSETDATGNLVRITPSIMGQFKDIVEDCFDIVLLCGAELAARNIKTGDRTVSQPYKRYYANTVPPDRYHTCKAPSGMPTVLEEPSFDHLVAAMSPGGEIK